MTMRQRRLAAFAAFNLLLIVGGWMMLVSPQRHDAAAASAQAEQMQTKLTALEISAKSPSRPPAVHTSGLYGLDTALPAQLDEPDLLFELDRMAAASGVQILGITPQPAQAAPANYTILPLNLQLNGKYAHLTQFLRTLRQLVGKHNGQLVANGPLFAVTGLAFTPATPGASNLSVQLPTSDSPSLVPLAESTDHGVNATVTLAAFYYGYVEGALAPSVATDTTTTDTTTSGG
ncbi:MAG: Pilus assembly protein PilO [Gaiellaceae bacterium]|jgi:hypothetical protein|nr:Pilus assembly protein PilO [Gaiellaceae bacterium]